MYIYIRHKSHVEVWKTHLKKKHHRNALHTFGPVNCRQWTVGLGGEKYITGWLRNFCGRDTDIPCRWYQNLGPGKHHHQQGNKVTNAALEESVRYWLIGEAWLPRCSWNHGRNHPLQPLWQGAFDWIKAKVTNWYQKQRQREHTLPKTNSKEKPLKIGPTCPLKGKETIRNSNHPISGGNCCMLVSKT